MTIFTLKKKKLIQKCPITPYNHPITSVVQSVLMVAMSGLATPSVGYGGDQTTPIALEMIDHLQNYIQSDIIIPKMLIGLVRPLYIIFVHLFFFFFYNFFKDKFLILESKIALTVLVYIFFFLMMNTDETEISHLGGQNMLIGVKYSL